MSNYDSEEEEEVEIVMQQQEVDQHEQSEAVATDATADGNIQAGGKISSKRRYRCWSDVPKQFSGSAAKAALKKFFSNSNVTDLVLTRNLFQAKPYLAPYGSKTAEWDDFAKQVNEEVLLVDDENIFGCVLTSKKCQARFLQLMDFAKKYSANVPFRSGDDSEDPPTELQSAIEQIYEDLTSHQSATQLCRNVTVADKERNKASAEILRNAALGLPIPQVPAGHPQRAMAVLELAIREQNQFLLVNDGVEGDPEEECESADQFLDMIPRALAGQRAPAGRRSPAVRQRAGASTPVAQRLEESIGMQVEAHFATSQLRAENKKRQLDMEQQRIALDERRVAMEEKQQEHRLAAETKAEERRVASEERLHALLLATTQNKSIQDNSGEKNK